MHKEGSAILFLECRECPAQLDLDLWQISSNSLAHLLFSQKSAWVISATFGALGQQSRSILRGRFEICTIFQQRLVLVYDGENWSSLLFQDLESCNLGFMGRQKGIGIDVYVVSVQLLVRLKQHT